VRQEVEAEPTTEPARVAKPAESAPVAEAAGASRAEARPKRVPVEEAEAAAAEGALA